MSTEKKKKQKKDKNDMSFLDHLEDLRKHLIRAVVAIGVGAVVAFVFKDFIFQEILFAPKEISFPTYQILCQLSQWIGFKGLCIDQINFVIQNRTMAGQFSSHIWVSIVVGIILGFPFLVNEIWKFVSPALHKKEKRIGRQLLSSSTLLLILGVLFGYYLIAPLSVNFLSNYEVSAEVENQIDLSSYVSFLSSILLASGLLFQLPIIVYFLAKAGLITSSFLKKYRRHAIVVILIIAAIITPPDVSSQVLITFPLFILYEISIWVTRRQEKRDKAKANA